MIFSRRRRHRNTVATTPIIGELALLHSSENRASTAYTVLPIFPHSDLQPSLINLHSDQNVLGCVFNPFFFDLQVNFSSSDHLNRSFGWF